MTSFNNVKRHHLDYVQDVIFISTGFYCNSYISTNLFYIKKCSLCKNPLISFDTRNLPEVQVQILGTENRYSEV